MGESLKSLDSCGSLFTELYLVLALLTLGVGQEITESPQAHLCLRGAAEGFLSQQSGLIDKIFSGFRLRELGRELIFLRGWLYFCTELTL